MPVGRERLGVHREPLPPAPRGLNHFFQVFEDQIAFSGSLIRIKSLSPSPNRFFKVQGSDRFFQVLDLYWRLPESEPSFLTNLALSVGAFTGHMPLSTLGELSSVLKQGPQYQLNVHPYLNVLNDGTPRLGVKGRHDLV